jgi:hypothetical protein
MELGEAGAAAGATKGDGVLVGADVVTASVFGRFRPSSTLRKCEDETKKLCCEKKIVLATLRGKMGLSARILK